VETVLFPLGVRLSTWLVATAFIGLAVWRRDWRPILAAWAWMTSWEAVFQTASIGFDRLPVGIDGPIFYIVLAVATVPVLVRYNIRPDWRVMGLAVAVFVVWVATGFHVNGHTMAGFDPAAEVLNEAAKTLWAVAFLLPLLRTSGLPVHERRTENRAGMLRRVDQPTAAARIDVQ